MLPLSRQLQTTSLDVIGALSHVEAVVQELRQSGFSTVFQAAVSMAEAANVEIRMPRVTSRQRHRQNIPAIDAEDYFRLTFPSLAGSPDHPVRRPVQKAPEHIGIAFFSFTRKHLLRCRSS
ncbi:unnamed protein product [Ixodes hexagonus]